jgi:hypothetical protein
MLSTQTTKFDIGMVASKWMVSPSMILCILFLLLLIDQSLGISKPTKFRITLPGKRYDDTNEEMEVDGENLMRGLGRDFDLFDTRPISKDGESERHIRNIATSQKRYKAYVPRRANENPSMFQNVQEWWSVNLPHFPKLIFRVEPTTTLKITKTFRPLGTIVKVGADFNTNLGVWQFKSSWEDAIIGGKLTLAGKELQLTKSWQLSMGKPSRLA